MAGARLRALKAAVIVMGVLILGGTAVLVAVIVRRASAPAPAASASALVPSGSLPYSTRLDVPAGSRITGVAAAGEFLAISVGGADNEVLVLDPRTGRTVGRVRLAPPG